MVGAETLGKAWLCSFLEFTIKLGPSLRQAWSHLRHVYINEDLLEDKGPQTIFPPWDRDTWSSANCMVWLAAARSPTSKTTALDMLQYTMNLSWLKWCRGPGQGSWGYDGGGWRTKIEINKKQFVPFRICLHSLVLLLTKQLIQVCQLLLFTLVNAKCIPNWTAGVTSKPVLNIPTAFQGHQMQILCCRNISFVAGFADIAVQMLNYYSNNHCTDSCLHF